MKLIPTRFLVGSTEPATAYTVGELREMLAELPDGLLLALGAELTVEEDYLIIRSSGEVVDLDDFVEDLDAIAERHETGGEG